MNDNAVAPVVAVMLVLAVIVTFLAVYNAAIIPSMKAEAEVLHIHDVEESFLRFAADIESAVCLKRTAQLSECIVLGGGDILLNGGKSGGTLYVRDEDEQIFSVECNGTSYGCTFVNISYVPVSNFWQDQGYFWKYGYVNVTQKNIETPLLYPNIENISANARSSGFFGSLIDIDSKEGFFPVNVNNPGGLNGTYTKSVAKRCTEITLSVVNFSVGRGYVSGNGAAMLTLNVSVQEPVIIDAPNHLNITVNEHFMGSDSVLPCGEPVIMACNSSLTEINEDYENICRYDPVNNRTMCLYFDNSATPVEVKIQMVDVVVSVC